jgi:hypothetical protein
MSSCGKINCQNLNDWQMINEPLYSMLSQISAAPALQEWMDGLINIEISSQQ